MKFSESWLREWVSPALDTQALSEQLSMAGLEVDGIEKVAGDFNGVVVGEVVACGPHPDADKLQGVFVTVDPARDTPELLKKQGVDYVFDWVVDDVPSWMQTRNGPLLALPYNLEINDSIVYAIEKHTSDEMYERLARTLALFEREAATHPRVLAIGLHPHLIGVPHRFASFERMLDLLMKSPQVCFKTGGQIADWYTAQVPAPNA